MPLVSVGSHDYRTAIHTWENLTLPDFQRSLVWTPQQKRDLLFSTLLGFPIGAICVGKEIDANTGNPVQYLLDGQQRLDCIIDMMNPANPCRWLDLKKPGGAYGFPSEPTPAETENYYGIQIWALIYEFLDFDFKSSSENDLLLSDSKYQAAQSEKIKQTQKKEVKKANEQKRIMFEMEFNALQSWVNRLHKEPPELPNENKAIPAFIAIYIQHLKDPEATVLQKSKWDSFDPSDSTTTKEQGYQILYEKLAKVKGDEDKIVACIFDAVDKNHLKTSPPTLNADPVKAQKQKDTAVNKFEEAITSSMSDITDYLTARTQYVSQIENHKVGWLTFDAGTTRQFHENELAKVFSLVNMSGVELSTIELLAARSGWREKVDLDKKNTDEFDLFEAYRKISTRMGLHRKAVTELEIGIVNKWHLASGFGAVMRDNQTSNELEWILSIPDDPEEPDKIGAILNQKKRETANKNRREAIEKLSNWGFITFGLLQFQSSHESIWKELDGHPAKWKEILKIIKECRGAGRLLRDDDFFKNLISFARSENGAIEGILGNVYAARCFFATMHIRYVELGCPANVGDKNGEDFIYEMRRLFDDLLYNSIITWWTGKVDTKLPDTIKNYTPAIYDKLASGDNRWEELLKEMCIDGTIKGADYHKNKADLSADDTTLKMSSGQYNSHAYAILAYHQVLQGRNRSIVNVSAIKENYKFEVDHIIPFDSWFTHLNPHKNDLIGTLRPMNFTHNITNLTLLGYDANRAKKHHTIDKWFDESKSDAKYYKIIQEQIQIFADLPIDADKLKKMNEPTKYSVLNKFRTKKLTDVFDKANRKKYLYP